MKIQLFKIHDYNVYATYKYWQFLNHLQIHWPLYRYSWYHRGLVKYQEYFCHKLVLGNYMESK